MREVNLFPLPLRYGRGEGVVDPLGTSEPSPQPSPARREREQEWLSDPFSHLCVCGTRSKKAFRHPFLTCRLWEKEQVGAFPTPSPAWRRLAGEGWGEGEPRRGIGPRRRHALWFRATVGDQHFCVVPGHGEVDEQDKVLGMVSWCHPLRRILSEHHHVSTTYERGWSTLKNGELLEIAERRPNPALCGFFDFGSIVQRLTAQNRAAESCVSRMKAEHGVVMIVAIAAKQRQHQRYGPAE
jgi:hypothetical protein